MNTSDIKIQITTSKSCFVIGVVLLIATIIDLFAHNFFIEHSARLTVDLQQSSGGFGEFFSVFFSVYFMIIILAIIILAVLIEPIKLKNYHVIFTCFVVGSFLTTAKSVYARGRPFLYNEKVQVPVCSCDHGMPSGHSGVTYLLLYFIEGYFWKWFKIDSTKVLTRLILRILLVFLGACVGLSRIIDGVHSYNQVFLGFLWASFLCELLSFELFEWIYINWIVPKFWIIVSIGLITISTLISQIIYYINSNYRSSHPEWIYWDKCKRCKNTFDPADLDQNSVPIILFFFSFCLNLHYWKYLNFSRELLTGRVKNLKIMISRVCLALLIAVPIPVLVRLVSRSKYDEIESLWIKGSLKFLLNLFFGCFVILSILFWMPMTYQKLKIDFGTDYLEPIVMDLEIPDEDIGAAPKDQ